MNDCVGPERELIVTAADGDAGKRVDRMLADNVETVSRTRLKTLIETGFVTCNGAVIDTVSRSVAVGDVFCINLPPAADYDPVAENIPLNIVFEDDSLLVIDKQAGLVVHPAQGHATGTLVNALLNHCGRSLSGINGVKRPGIVHRLDKDTSGLMVVAKNDNAHANLSDQLATRTLSRRYIAFVWGIPSPAKGVTSCRIGRHPTDRKRMAVVTKGGKEATTHYQVLSTYGSVENGATLASQVSCKLETGRTHQIRVHMQALGNPLIGDRVYGVGRNPLRRRDLPNLNRNALAIAADFPRQALHATEISFQHPADHRPLSFESPIPNDLAELERNLKSL